MYLQINHGNGVGQARWRVVRHDGQWSRTLDEVVIVLANCGPSTTTRLHTLRLRLRANCPNQLAGINPLIEEPQTRADLDAGLAVGVVDCSPGGLWTLNQTWRAALDVPTLQSVDNYASCFGA